MVKEVIKRVVVICVMISGTLGCNRSRHHDEDKGDAERDVSIIIIITTV